MKVLAAMSGGVDSAVAAARAVADGHEVVGVHLALSRSPQTLRTGSRGCCSREDAGDARRVADMLGIPFYVWDFAERFQADVIDEFVASYAAGETPNPCLRCNEKIKFEALLERGIALGFDAVATGHYAQWDGKTLRRAIDPSKDQSYVLGVLTPHQLAHSMFPLGDSLKTDIRVEAERSGFSVASKPDSHDICFIPSGDTQAFLGQHIGIRSGAVVDAATGAELAQHDGIQNFTIGQRKGLGLAGPAEDGKPRYVTDIDPDNAVVTVGSMDDLLVDRIVADRVYWLADQALIELDCQVQVRAHGGIVDAHLVRVGDTLEIDLLEPLRGVARGQAAVVYLPDVSSDIVLGSGTICRTHSVNDRSAVTAGRAGHGASSESSAPVSSESLFSATGPH